MAQQIKKVVLAYSGGLDTSIIIPWSVSYTHLPAVLFFNWKGRIKWLFMII